LVVGNTVSSGFPRSSGGARAGERDDAAFLSREQWSRPPCGIVHSDVCWHRQIVLIGEKSGAARGTMEQQAAFCRLK
jgi:hypothetical protein